MLPFGVTIPATVPQGSEIPEGLMNNPVFPRTIPPLTHSNVQQNLIIFPQYGRHGFGTVLAQTICTRRINGAKSLTGKGPVRTSYTQLSQNAELCRVISAVQHTHLPLCRCGLWAAIAQ